MNCNPKTFSFKLSKWLNIAIFLPLHSKAHSNILNFEMNELNVNIVNHMRIHYKKCQKFLFWANSCLNSY